MWAFALGCIIGWGSFVMPGTTFLPDAGPIGTAIGLLVSCAAVLVIAINYAHLSSCYPDEIGSYAFTKHILGSDHAFLAIWSLALAYLSLLWANATAFVLIGRYLLGDVFQFGFYYELFGYDVYFGEVLVTIAVQVVFGLVACFARRLAVVLRTLLAIGLLASVIALFVVAVNSGSGPAEVQPFAEQGPVGLQVLSIFMLAPWMFVGFEVVFQDEGSRSSSLRCIAVAAVFALMAGAAIYLLLTFIASSGTPTGYDGWRAYVADLGSQQGIDAMPVLFNAQRALGADGLKLVAVVVFCALSTSILGFYQASARVVTVMASNGLLPRKLAEIRDGSPRNALLAIMLVSLPISLMGRTAVGWNADVSTLSVSIVYAYISICAFSSGRERGVVWPRISGIVGLVVTSLAFFLLLVPNIFMESALAPESYFLLATWSLIGILYYRLVLRRDVDNTYGKSPIMWIMMLFLFLFAVNVWARLSAQKQIIDVSARAADETAWVLTSISVIQIAAFVVALLIMFSLFSTMIKRQQQLDLKVIQSEERNRAKTAFLSNMSHDIRTPMNAIIGFTNLALESTDDEKRTHEYLEKIRASSTHLLSLINDILEMSRIESGKIELEETPMDLSRLLDDLQALIEGQAREKDISLDFSAHLDDELVYGDRLRLNQIMLNLLSNAVKYTPEGGTVEVSLTQLGAAEEGCAPYEIRVKDNGIGMDPEFAERVFEAFEREKTSTVSGIQGTGLGMAITKNIVDLMGGTIGVKTALGEGSEFTVKLQLRVVEDPREIDAATLTAQQPDEIETSPEVTFEGMRILLVDDIDLNREIAMMVLEMSGFEVEQACDGQEAVRMVAESEPGYYDAVLMDIQMPVMNGHDATRAIRNLPDEAHSQIPIIAVTANAFEEDRIAAFDAGMDGHLPKPIDVDELIDTLKSILSAR